MSQQRILFTSLIAPVGRLGTPTFLLWVIMPIGRLARPPTPPGIATDCAASRTNLRLAYNTRSLYVLIGIFSLKVWCLAGSDFSSDSGFV